MFRNLLKLLATVSLIVLVGCANTRLMNQLSIGMTKTDVTKILGSPNSTSAKKGVEVFTYHLYPTNDDATFGRYKPYYVSFVSGVVESYGETDPTLNLNVRNKN